jgi:hypothetical protein
VAWINTSAPLTSQALYLLILCPVPITKYRTEPRKGRKIISSTQRIFSFPGNSLIRALISANKGSRKRKSITRRVIKSPPPNRKRKVIV